ncbi:MAG: Mur ligase family protein, partial [Magnetovibrio sp.]|nr:Mur ligase family protein [Magnetovibrio sp.]
MSRAENSVLWTDADAAAATAGEAAGGWRATGVSIDTRTLAPGDLFVAISGPNFDGHDFAAEALTKGAAAVLVAAANPATAKLDPAAPRLVAADTLAALEDLGRAARARTGARIAAVTGSVGKTGTKEALGLALGAQGRIAATAGNLNNHWGLPLSLARMPAATDFGIFELGMSAPGEIAPLTAMTRPHVAVITAIAHVHSEFFPSLDGIADAKAEIFLGLEPGGTAILNRDSDYFDHLAGKAREAGAANIVGFGAATAADYRLLDCTLGDDGSEVLADLAGR